MVIYKNGLATGGWEDVLTCCGFQVRGPMSVDGKTPNGMRMRQPKSVFFFPEHDDSGIHQTCIALLEALLGLNADVLRAISMLLRAPQVSSSLRSLLQCVLNCLQTDQEDEGIIVALEFSLWDVVGCRQLLEALSFVPREENDGEVILLIPCAAVDQDMITKTIEILASIIGPLESCLDLLPAVAEAFEGLTTEL